MYHHHSQQQGPPQPSSNRPGPTHHQQQPNQQQQQNRFKYPPPSHLPDELVSTMATRGSGDIDHCLMDLMNRPNPNQRSRTNPDQMSGTAGYSSDQLGHQQGMDWSNYPHPSQMFASPPSTVTQQSKSSPSGIGNQAWMQAPVYDPPSPQTRGSQGGGNGGGGVVDKQGLYTPERAECILATLGLSNEDLEFLSQYPEDQLNPDNLPFILRFIQTNKSKSQNSAASSSYSQSASRAIHDILPPPARSGRNTGRLRSPEVPRYHSVPQAAGKVIDYGHASQVTDDSSGRESMPERRHARLQPFEPNKHVDLDYCRSGGEVHKNKRLSPAREFPPLYRSRHPDREYSRDGPRPSPSSETWNDSSSSSRDSRHPVLKSHGATMRLPTPTMMCDFSAESPKVYPHPGSLCEVDCEHAKSAKDPPAKKMKKVSTQKKMKKVSSQSTPSSTAACLVYLTGIPTTATEQEVKMWVRDFGKYNNVVLLSGSEADQGQKASVCMEREEDALALAQCSSLSIGDQPITATLAKKPEADDSTAVSKGTSSQELSAIGGEDSGNGPELDRKTGEECSSNSTVLITGLPESGWTESDVIKLCQPFGAPSDIILATQSGKALLLMPDAEMAEEMVKNHSVAPMKINDSELKMTNLEQAISLNTPVALYNLLHPGLEVNWNHLLVIRNIPDTPTASSEVQKLIERIGTVHDILVLNHNMIICEMLTAGAVARIRNHYHKFPCIVQSNPLYFTSWRDPIDQNLVWGPHWLPPCLTASLDSLKESPDDDKDNHTVPTADSSIRQEIGKYDYLVELCYEGTVIGFYCKICDVSVDSIGIDPMHIDAHLNGKRHEMLSSQNEEYVEEVNKNVNLRRFYCHLCKCYINDLKSKILHLKGRKHVASLMENQRDCKRARKVKRGKLRDETGEKTSSKDEAAGKAASKERKSKYQQDIKVGEELSDAAPTQVEADVKTDKIKVSLSKQRKERKTTNTSREKLDKINSGPRETKSSRSAAGDGEASSSKPAHLDLPKVKSEEDQFQDFPDLQDFVTVDEVGDVNDFPSSPPPGAVAMDTTVMVDKESPADDKDSHTVATADKEDSTPQENETSVPGEKKKAVKMDNRNAEGDAKISGKDGYFEEIYLNGRDRLHCKLCNGILPNITNGIFLKEAKEEHLKGRRHTISLLLLVQKSETDEYLKEFCTRKGKFRFRCILCKYDIALDDREEHLKGKTHRRMLELKRDLDAKKLKEGELRDYTDEKTISKDEAAGKGPRSSLFFSETPWESPDDDKDSHIVLTPQQNGTYDHLVDICYDGTAIDFFCTLCEIPLRGRGAIFVDSHLNGKMHRGEKRDNPYRGEKRDKIEILSEDKCIVAINGQSSTSSIFYCSLCKCNFNVRSKSDGHLKGKQHIASLWERMKDGKLKGEDSSCKPAHLELPKYICTYVSEGDQFQDFPFDMTDFVTVDEVGDVNDITGPPPPPPPPDAVATDTTATVEEAGDESDLPACPPPPAVVPMDTSEAVVVMVKSTEEEERKSEAEATPVPEDTPWGLPGPLTLATAAPERSETTATASESPACVEPTLDPVVTAEQHPHSPVPPQAMCSSDQLDAPVPLPVADDSLPASAPATTASSPKGATTPEACSSGVTPAAGGEQENQGPVGHSQAEEEVTEKVEQMEDDEDKEKTAASVSAKRRIPEEKEEEPMQKKQKTHGATADNPPPPPPFDPNSAVGMEFLVPKRGFFCKLCNRFFTGGRESELNHCKSQKHHENWQKYLKSKKTTSR